MPDNTDSFFKERQPAAVLKHGILRRYAEQRIIDRAQNRAPFVGAHI